MPANTPEEMAATWEAAFNTGDVDQVMARYEPDSLLVPQPGQKVAGTAAVREALLGFFAVKGKIRLTSKRVLQSGDIALLNGHWDLNGTGPDGSPVSMGGDTNEVIRRQADGTWRYVIDDPFDMP